jgi:hypothetical protein
MSTNSFESGLLYVNPVKVKGKVFPFLTNKALRHEGVWGSGYIDHIFLTSALVGGEWSASCLGRFIPGKRAPGTHWIGGGMGPRVGLGEIEK